MLRLKKYPAALLNNQKNGKLSQNKLLPLSVNKRSQNCRITRVKKSAHQLGKSCMIGGIGLGIVPVSFD